MSWAKYLEDDIEIMTDRLYMKRQDQMKASDTPVCVAESHNVMLVQLLVETAITLEQPQYKDKHILCKDCGKKFLFSAQAQRQFDAKGWTLPKRCKYCRGIKEARYLMCASF